MYSHNKRAGSFKRALIVELYRERFCQVFHFQFFIIFSTALSEVRVNFGLTDYLSKSFFVNMIFFSHWLIVGFREGNHPEDFSRLTYKKLLEEVCRFSNVLKSHGVRRGDRISIYMPMVLELPIAVLACCRIGAVHSIVVSSIDKIQLPFFN